MAETSKPVYCFDTSVLLAWFKEEKDAPLNEIESLINDVHTGKAVLLVPATVVTEILDVNNSASEQLEEFLERDNVVHCDITLPVSRQARKVRERGATLPKKHQARKIKTPDAQIIAVAIVYEADALYSMEPKHHSLSGSKIVDGLVIMSPRDPSGQMFLPGT